MDRHYSCIKKDKRLLVLLAFGLVIVFSDLRKQEDHDSGVKQYAWLELIDDSEENLLRLDKNKLFMRDDLTLKEKGMEQGTQFFKTLSARLADEKIVSITKKNQGKTPQFTSVSPRLAFLLGNPMPINYAGLEELSLVPGIGNATAWNIIQYREETGQITNAHQLEKVQGIGQKTRKHLQRFFSFTTTDARKG